MKCSRGLLFVFLFLCELLSVSYSVGQSANEAHTNASGKKEKGNDSPVDPAILHNPVLWHDPGQISALDLFNGRGQKEGEPAPPFQFVSEDMKGTNPKFDVKDARGIKWRVKLGNEAQPEVVASRLLWAVGYYVEDDYVLPSADVEDLHMERGANLIQDGQVTDGRFARKADGEKKIGIWRWKKNPFTGTRELNGLRVMMAIMNNWDLKDENNAVFADKDSGRDIFLASDIGATFGTNGLSWSKGRSKGDAETFEQSKFITRQTEKEVDFATPAAPTLMRSPNVKEFTMRKGMEWIGKDIPITDARWIGSLLKQLSHQQLVDAFRAGNFSQKQIDTYVEIVQSRIDELAAL